MIADLARRGLTHPHTVAYVKRAVSSNPEGPEEIDIPVWGGILVYVSFIIAAVGFSLLSYMLNEVITTLCMVESPTTAITVSPAEQENGDKEEKEGLLEDGAAITLVNQKPITSSIRGTIKHLVAHAGRWARFRGYKIHLLYSLLTGITSTLLSVIIPKFPGQSIIVAALTGVALVNVHATWTHKVVSMPTDKSFRARFVSLKHWKTLALPAAVEAAMPFISLYLTCGVGMLLGLHKLEPENSGGVIASVIARVVFLIIFVFTCSLFLCLPAIVTLVRIEASLLPADEHTIVPFDRTFGGKLVSQLMGGSGKVAFLDAWRSFNWEARRRLIKLFVKVFFIQAGLFIIVVHLLAAEIILVMGPAVGKFLAQLKANTPQ